MILEISVAMAVSFAVLNSRQVERESWLGVWTLPVAIVIIFAFLYFISYYPNIKSHERCLKEFGEEYQNELEKVVEEAGWRWIFINGWFKKYYEKRISEREGLDIRKFVLGDENDKNNKK